MAAVVLTADELYNILPDCHFLYNIRTVAPMAGQGKFVCVSECSTGAVARPAVRHSGSPAGVCANQLLLVNDCQRGSGDLAQLAA